MSFSVAKKVEEDDITKFFAKGRKAGKSVEEMNNLLKDRVLGEIQDAVENRKIPGPFESRRTGERNGRATEYH